MVGVQAEHASLPGLNLRNFFFWHAFDRVQLQATNRIDPKPAEKWGKAFLASLSDPPQHASDLTSKDVITATLLCESRA